MLCVSYVPSSVNYVGLDEADRMIDMGFEPQVVAVLENMGSMLKSENEDEMEKQLTLANGANVVTELRHRFRVTTMFSATMPVEVERLAMTFLRHPSIGDDDPGKNKRIDQQVLFMNPGKKRLKLVEILREILSPHSVPVPRSRKEKIVDGADIIVFVNIKKECDAVAKFITSEGHLQDRARTRLPSGGGHARATQEEFVLKRAQLDATEGTATTNETDGSLAREQIANRQQERERLLRTMQAHERDRMQEMASREAETMGTHWSEKSLEDMKERD
ncbi:hypothetical protein PsorP6_018927 [Peronosclerospora sorghi]|nr:hypothetical protein PsorP6_018927 [Peronosclerospora sorghi]